MATVSYSANKTMAEGALEVPMGFVSAVLDCSSQNMGSSDIWEALSIPAGAMVSNVGLAVLTAAGGTLTVDVGITGGAADGFLDGVNGNETAGLSYNSLNAATGADTYSGGYYFSSADTIDVLFNNAISVGKFLVYAHYFVSRTS